MKIIRLFKVLVVGGSLLGVAASCEADGDTEAPDASESAAVISPDDAGAEDGAISSQDADLAGTEPVDCGFCPNEACCDQDEAGNGTVKDGFECCWATTC